MTKPRAASRPKTAELVAAELRREIATGNLRAGDKLHPERLLCEQFEVSRPTLREALRLLEAESLIRISRGQYGGAEVTSLDIGVAAKQVGLSLQMEGATLEDVWRARAVLEPAAAAEVARSGNRQAIADLEESIKGALGSMEDPVEYAAFTSQFEEILTRYCENKTLRLLISLIQDIVRRQHRDVTVTTYAAKGIDRMMMLNIRGRERLVELIKKGDAEEAEKYWRSHLVGAGKVVFSAYRAQMPIDVLGEPMPPPGPRSARQMSAAKTADAKTADERPEPRRRVRKLA
jgi:GntR family transcriptional repressor for pyruvate dehydrogenase complex